jgi:Ca2+-binding EF-hand superfamily protein
MASRRARAPALSAVPDVSDDDSDGSSSRQSSARVGTVTFEDDVEEDPPVDEEEEQLRAVFDSVDIDGSGFLDRSELQALSVRLGRKLKKKKLDKAMKVRAAP